MAQGAGGTRDPASKPESLEHQKSAVERAPGDERPAGAVPHPAQQEHDEQIDVGARGPASAAAEWDEKIVAKPRRQRDVPAPPEVSDRIGGVRQAEVLRQ